MMSNEILFAMCRNKSVLQLGVLGDYKRYLANNNLEDWDYLVLAKISKKSLGLDVDREGVRAVNKLGITSVKYGDAENLSLNEKFDVIFAGDLIEHLNNPGKFIESAKKAMHAKSILAITTPNPYSFNFIVRAIAGRTSQGIYDDHTALFHPKTIDHLFWRYGLKTSKISYYTLVDNRSYLTRLMSAALIVIGKIVPYFNQTYMIQGVLDARKTDLKRAAGKPRQKGRY